MRKAPSPPGMAGAIRVAGLLWDDRPASLPNGRLVLRRLFRKDRIA